MSVEESRVDVYVKLPTGRTAVYYMSPDETIESLCQKVAEEEKIMVKQVRLKYQGKFLKRCSSMAELGVRAETTIKAEILVPQSVFLAVALPEELGRTVMTFSNLDSIADVTKIIADFIQEEEATIRLMHEGEELRQADVTLLDIGLNDGSEVSVRVNTPLQTVSAGERRFMRCCIEYGPRPREEMISDPEVLQWCEHVRRTTSRKNIYVCYYPEEVELEMYRDRRLKQFQKDRKCSCSIM